MDFRSATLKGSVEATLGSTQVHLKDMEREWISAVSDTAETTYVFFTTWFGIRRSMVQIHSPRPLQNCTFRRDPLQNAPETWLTPVSQGARQRRSSQSLAVGLDIAIVDSHTEIHESQCCRRQE